MNTHLQNFKFSNQLPTNLSLTTGATDTQRYRLWASRHSQWALGILSVVLVISMVVIFYRVVGQSVHQSGLRQQALAAQSQAIWRCRLLPGIAARHGCLEDIPVRLSNDTGSLAEPVSP
jgi:hypothetical protein